MEREQTTIGKRSGAKWNKVLYLRQGVSDNYVPPCFLDELRKNVNCYFHNLSNTFLAAAAVTQEISSVGLFVMLFVYLDVQILSPSVVLTGATAISLCLFVCYLTMLDANSPKVKLYQVIYGAKNVLIFLCFGYGVSPILKTLTDTISTDTIYAMVTMMMITHLLFYDYGADAAFVSKSMSLNAAIFATVCLASRLPSTYHAFTLLIAAVEMFVLGALFRRKLQESSWVGHVFVTILLALSSVAVTATVSAVCALLLAFVLVFVNVVCPVWFYQWQAYKQNIYGPWDEAVISEHLIT